MTIRQGICLLLITTTALVVISCTNKRHFEQNINVPDASWAAHSDIPFTVVIDDTSARYDFYVNIRNEVDYPYSNLFLFLQTTSPDQQTARDTIECLLADYDGRWLGSGMGSVKFNRFLFQRAVKFSKPGTYIFEFEQAMRIDPLKGIRDIGIRIDKSQ